MVKAVTATGRKPRVIAGVVNDVCAFPTLSSLAEGYQVFVVCDASGTFHQSVGEAALRRMAHAGALMTHWFAAACECSAMGGATWKVGGHAARQPPAGLQDSDDGLPQYYEALTRTPWELATESTCPTACSAQSVWPRSPSGGFPRAKVRAQTIVCLQAGTDVTVSIGRSAWTVHVDFRSFSRRPLKGLCPLEDVQRTSFARYFAMRQSRPRSTHPALHDSFDCGKRCGIAAGILLLISLAGGVCGAQEGTHVWRVEEEWELVVADPDSSTVGPQVTCTISPRGDLAGQYATLDLNHRSAPTFMAGGVHLHMWYGESRTTTISKGSTAVLATPHETICWKTVMTLQDGVLTVDIDDGSSATWGEFGNGVLYSVNTSLPNLDRYSADVSAANSGVGFASNRVKSLKLKRVTGHLSNGQAVVDSTERVVHSLD
jgi:hypothetical protein